MEFDPCINCTAITNPRNPASLPHPNDVETHLPAGYQTGGWVHRNTLL